MSKKLLEVLPSLQSFKNNIISPLTIMFHGAEWLNDATSYTKQETIYRLLILKYGDRIIRYDDDSIFLNRLVFDLADLLPDIYAKQQVFIKNKLNEFLSDNKNRAVIIDNETTNTRNSNSNSKLGNSASPLNLVISSADEIINAPITSSNLSNVKLLENYNCNNQQVNYNFVNDLVKTLNADYSLRLNEFMEMLGKHFVNVVGSFYKSLQCNNQTVKDEPYRFNNGYVVNEVDYLGTQNQQSINATNERVERLSDQVATKQNQLTAGDNITINNNVISANIPNVDLNNYYTKQEIDNQQLEQDKNITTNSTNIVKVDNKINDVINELNSLDGEVKTIKTDLGDLDNQLVDVNNKFNDYYTKTQINQTVNTINENISNNRNDINNLENQTQTLTNDVNTLKTNVEDVNNKFDDYYTINELSNYSVVLKAKQFKVSENTKIDNYNDTEIVITAPQKITSVAVGDDNVEKFRTEVSTNGFYINNYKTISTYEASNLDTSSKVIDLGNKRKLLIFRFNWPTGNATDSWDNLPKEIKYVNNIAYIEQVDFNMYFDGVVYASVDCYPKVGIEANRLYITRTSASSAYWNGKQARFRIIVTTS